MQSWNVISSNYEGESVPKNISIHCYFISPPDYELFLCHNSLAHISFFFKLTRKNTRL
jgi:hypothetical protein